MIPSIETIVEDLVSGAVSPEQAIAWLHLHAEGMANDLRNHFAALALQGMLANPSAYTPPLLTSMPTMLSHEAYLMADAMLAESSMAVAATNGTEK